MYYDSLHRVDDSTGGSCGAALVADTQPAMEHQTTRPSCTIGRRLHSEPTTMGEKGRTKEERPRTSRWAAWQPDPQQLDRPQFYDAPRDRTTMGSRLAGLGRYGGRRCGGGGRGRACGRLTIGRGKACWPAGPGESRCRGRAQRVAAPGAPQPTLPVSGLCSRERSAPENRQPPRDRQQAAPPAAWRWEKAPESTQQLRR